MMQRVHVILALALAARQAAGSGATNFRGTGNVSEEEAGAILFQEEADRYHHLASFEDALRKLFTSLPKNHQGNLGHDTIRYAVRRYFMSKFGWLIRGLEADSVSTGWVSDIMATVEHEAGQHGVDLRGLATLVASLEDFTDRNSQERLMSAFNTTFDGQELGLQLSHDQAADVLETYVMMSLSPTTWKIKSREDLRKKKAFFREHLTGQFGRVTELLYRPMQERYLGSANSTATVNLESLTDMATEMDHDFHVFFDKDCQAMKTQLSRGQGKRPGRVRLAAFYNMSLYGDWSFVEKEAYLRAAGALDDSNPPHVIIANYALGRLNCLNETAMYSVCCRNTCEDLQTQLEDKIGGPSATAESIAMLVATMPSESTKAPRILPESLLARLDEVAQHHGGQVPIHGRLFSQWMHHAFPLECPYPQENGASKSQSVEQWLVDTGETTHELTVEEIKQQVEADLCTMKDGFVDCGEESSELPWSMAEELLAPNGEQAGAPCYELALLFLAAATVLGAPLLRSCVAASFSFAFIKKSPDLQNRATAAVVMLATSAYMADFLDGLIFAAALGSCSVAVVARLLSQRLGTSMPMAKQV